MQRLTGLDAGFLYMETPSLHMHTLKVAVLAPPPGGPPGFGWMRAEIGRTLGGLAPLRRRLVEVPGRFHHPVWIDGGDLDLDHHVRRVVLPPPGDRRTLEAAIGALAGVPLDRRRPLWCLYLFEGLADGRIAVLVKLHHAVADGAAASALLAAAMQAATGDPATRDAPAGPRWPAEPVPSRRRLVADACVDHARQLVALPGLVRRTARTFAALRTHRRSSTVRPPRPVLDTPRTPFNGALSPYRAFATATVALADARAVRHAFGVSLNDVVLAMVAGAVRSYLADRGELPARPLVVGVPVAADPPGAGGSRLEGNRVSNLFTTLATDQADPVARLRTIHRVTAEAKQLQRLLGTDTFAAWVQYTPPRPYAWVVRQWSRRRIADRLPPPINLVVSNVAGPAEVLAAAGARLEELYSVGPVLEGIGLNVTVWSYADRLGIGVLTCRRALPEPADLAGRMAPALAELVASIPVAVAGAG